MPDDPAATLRDQAREWGRSLLDASPWHDVSDRVTLLVVTPPTGLDALVVPGRAMLWLAIDGPSARSLPAEFARPLAQDEAVVRHHRAVGEAPAVALAAMTDDALHRLLQGTSRRSMEARWHIRHVEVVSDRLHRAEQYQARAGLLPHEAVERIVRTLWVETAVAAQGIDAVRGDRPADALAVAGETVAALLRLACLWDDGSYPAAEYLRVAAGETRIGRRMAPWIDDAAAAIGGDEGAARRLSGSRDQALSEVRGVLAERYRSRGWLNEPEAFALRAPR